LYASHKSREGQNNNSSSSQSLDYNGTKYVTFTMEQNIIPSSRKGTQRHTNTERETHTHTTGRERHIWRDTQK